VRRRAIERRPGASTGELLRDQPGVWTNGENLFYITPNIRGAFGNQTLLLVDGARLNNATLFAGDNRLFQTLDPENIDRIEIVRGPGSVLWGSDALGGLVHVFTRPPPSWPANADEKVWTGRASATLGSVDRLARYRSEAGVATEDVRVRAGVTTFSVGDTRSAGSLGVMSPSGWSGRAVDGRLDYRIAERHLLTLEFQQHENAAGQNYEIAFSRPTVTDNSRQLLLVRYDGTRLAPGVESLQAWAYVQRQHEAQRNLASGQETTTNVLTASGDAQLRSPLGPGLRLTSGLHQHTDWAESVGTSGARRSRSFPTGSWINGAAFLLGEADLGSAVSLLVGARADVFYLQTDPDAAAVPAGLTEAKLRVHETTLAPTGSVGLVGHLAPWLNAVASASRGFRAPNISDQVSSGPFRNGYSFPSPGLKPESTYNLEGGVRVQVPRRISAAITGWYTFYRDLIQSELRNPDLTSTDCVDSNANGKCDANEHVYVKHNVGRAHTTGLEATITAYLPAHFALSLVGTHTRARLDDTDQPISFLPPTNATVAVRYEPGRFYAELWARLVAPIAADDIPCSRIATDAAFHRDPRDVTSPLLGTLTLSADKTTCGGDYPGYVTFGARGGARVTTFLDAAIALNNLTNRAYRDKDARFDGAAFGAMGTLTLHEPEPLP
jgi:hemoglobin/transferrin/lactoferrin receptor protein